MKKLLALLLSFILLAQLPATTAFASFDDQQAGARAPGMADAYVAVADDADSISYNPAGLVQMSEGQLTSQYGQLVKGLGDGSTLGTTYLGYAFPMVQGYRGFGVAFQNFKADNLFNERTIILSYGHRLDVEPYGFRGIYSLGGNLKQLHRQFEPDRFTQNAINDSGVASNQKDQLFSGGNSKDTYAVDVGGLAQFGSSYQYTAGVSLINLNQPDVSLGGDGDKAPLIMKAGVAYRPRWGTITAENRRAQRLKGQTDSDLLFGVERNVPFADLGAFLLRGGYGTGSRGFKTVTMGLSYLYSRFRLDYAFNFPISELAGTSGSHRLGFSFKMGGASAAQLAKDYSDYDLLKAFSYDSLTTHVLLTRISLARNFIPDQKEALMLLLMRKYALDDAGLADVRGDLRDLIHKRATDLMDWPHLKFSFVKGLPDQEKANALDALELLVKNDAKSALMRLSLLPADGQHNDRMSAVTLMALSELAAQSYRQQDFDPCIDYVRRMVEILPTDEVVLKAYRALLAQRGKISEEPEQIELPEAPQTLVAPKPQKPAAIGAGADVRDALVRAFGMSLGYYLERKSMKAPANELVSLLKQMKATYAESKLDLSLVDRELAELEPAPAPVEKISPPPVPEPAPLVEPVAAPVEKPVVVKPAATIPEPAVEPAPASVPAPAAGGIWSDPDMQRAWDFYRDAAAREISDHEKVELLEGMLRKFGEKGAARINKELERIRKRLE